jgi:hypothetical protein
VKRLPLVFAALALFSGCGGSGGGGAASPSEEPARAMQRLVQYELAGQLERSYAMLVREQRAIVTRSDYVRCRPGPPMSGIAVIVLGVTDETIDVPALGKTKTKAVRWRISLPDAEGNDITQADTGHLIAQDGEWRWTLSPASFASFKQRVCPY